MLTVEQSSIRQECCFSFINLYIDMLVRFCNSSRYIPKYFTIALCGTLITSSVPGIIALSEKMFNPGLLALER